ncbi:MAG: triose-phosphate isomerase, partial [Myxococcota bacterium]
MARRKIICGNWKMNTTLESAKALVEGIKPQVAEFDIDVAVAPPFTALSTVAAALAGSKIQLAAQ